MVERVIHNIGDPAEHVHRTHRRRLDRVLAPVIVSLALVAITRHEASAISTARMRPIREGALRASLRSFRHSFADRRLRAWHEDRWGKAVASQSLCLTLLWKGAFGSFASINVKHLHHLRKLLDA
jgi:hypothetical protein